jgi:biopolymer transport protein ExbD
MPLKTHLDDQPTLNLTPMIDVVFLLIIFFMVGTKFTELERNVAVKVPQVNDLGALSPAPARRTINVHRDGRIALDRQFVTIDQLQSILAAARREYDQLGVVVRGDAESSFQTVATVLSACRQAGVADMGISVRLASSADTNPVR